MSRGPSKPGASRRPRFSAAAADARTTGFPFPGRRESPGKNAGAAEEGGPGPDKGSLIIWIKELFQRLSASPAAVGLGGASRRAAISLSLRHFCNCIRPRCRCENSRAHVSFLLYLQGCAHPRYMVTRLLSTALLISSSSSSFFALKIILWLDFSIYLCLSQAYVCY